VHLLILILGASVLVAAVGVGLAWILCLASRSADDDWAALDDASLTVTCAWCGRHLRGPAQVPGAAVSHGICSACAAKQLHEIHSHQSPVTSHQSH